MRSVRRLAGGIALVLRISFRATPRLTLVGLLLLPAAQALTILGGLWLKFLVNGVLAHATTQTLVAAGLMALSGGAAFLAGGAGYQIRARISELAGVEFERQLAEITASIPTLEHHERPDYLDRLRLLRENIDYLRQALSGIFGILASLASAAAALILLGHLYLPLLLLPVFWLPRQLADVAVLRWIGEVWESDAENLRALDHLETLGTAAGPAKEVLISGLREELLRRHQAALRQVARPRRRHTGGARACSSRPPFLRPSATPARWPWWHCGRAGARRAWGTCCSPSSSSPRWAARSAASPSAPSTCSSRCAASTI